MFYILYLKIIKMNLLFILLPLHKTCITNNHSTYVIPDANLCVSNFNNKEDGYLFGPCSKDIVECEAILRKCRFAQHRDKYCFSRDAHFCALIEVGNYTNFYQVECG